MQYLGGKSRLAQQIVDVIIELRGGRTSYLEPFVGGGSIVTEVARRGVFSSIRAGDLVLDLILLWRALQFGWIPPAVDESLYSRLKNAEPSPLRAFAGFGCSFGGKWFGGFARYKTRDYAATSRRVLENQLKFLGGVIFDCKSYEAWEINTSDVVYCDPPYKGTTGYQVSWDADKFWFWAESASRAGVLIIVSEFAAPLGWVSVWERSRKIAVSGGDGTSKTEHLYVHEVHR